VALERVLRGEQFANYKFKYSYLDNRGITCFLNYCMFFLGGTNQISKSAQQQ